MSYSGSIQLTNDANGTTYAFLADNGAIWQCQWNAQAQRWEQGQVIPQAFGGLDPQVLYLPELWPNGQSQGNTSNAGLVLAYRLGEGSNAEIYASFGAWGRDGQLGWSAPAALTSDGAEDQQFALVPAENGVFSLVVQKQEATRTLQQQLEQADLLSRGQGTEQELQQLAIGSRPDQDLYQSSFQLKYTDETAVGITLEQLESAANGTQSWQQLAPLMQAQPSTAPVTSAPQLAFAPSAELQRSQLLPAQTLLGASDPTAQNSGIRGSSRQGNRLWTKSDPLQLRKRTPRGSVTAGPGFFPTRFLVNLGGTNREPPSSPHQSIGPGSGELDNEDDIIEKNLKFESISSSIEDSIEDSIEVFQGDDLNEQDVLIPIRPDSNHSELGSLGGYGNWLKGGGGWNFILSGLFGGVNQGSGSSAVVNTAKGQFLFPKRGQHYLGNGFSSMIWVGKNGGEDFRFVGDYRAITGGLGTKSTFSYARGILNPLNLTRYTSSESAGIGWVWYSSRNNNKGGFNKSTIGVNGGVLAQQFHSGITNSLPQWLAGTGRGIEAESIFFNVAGFGFGKAFSKTRDFDVNMDINPLTTQADAPGELRRSDRYARKASTATKAIIPVFNGFVVPAATDILLKVKESSAPDRGIGAFFSPFGTYEYLNKYLVGPKVVFADQLNYFFKGSEQGELQNTTYASVGSAIAFGGYIPLLTYYYRRTWDLGASSASSRTTATDPGSGDQSATTDPQVAASSATSSSTGSFSSAASGSNYPFLYNPDAPSSARVTSLANNPINAQMLGEAPAELYQFNLQATSDSTLFTIKSAGSALTPTGTTPVEVDILGPTLESNAASSGSTALNSRAKALVSINANGELESISISQPGSYLYLPETGNNTGEYFLPLDLASAGLINSTGLPPVVSVNSATADSSGAPLQLNRIERIAAQLYPVASGTSANASQQYPQLNPDGSSAPVNTRNNSYYYYNNVPIYLSANPATSTGQSTPVALINTNATARVVFSNNQVVSIQPLQELTFLSSNAGSNGYTLVADLASYGESIANAEIAALQNISLSIPRAESNAYNNVVSESQFSSQAGASSSGVYIADGIADTLPLFPEYGSRPVSNRVVWYNSSYDSATNQSTTTRWFLNATTSSGVGTSVEPNYINDDNDSNLPSFSAASNPTAVTIAGSGAGKFQGDTLVAWVEATKPVIPITSGDGEQNFQAFMDAIYGDQRINYRINQASTNESSGWAAMDTNDLAELYRPEGAVITELRSFNVSNPFTSDPDDLITLLAWTEIPLPGSSDPTAAIKVAMINAKADSYQWSDLTTDANGDSTITTIPWDGSTAAALAINDISIAALTTTGPDGALIETPVLSFSRDVRTPYRQSVLNDQPSLYLQFGALTPGISSINIGTTGDDTTQTYASDTGLDFSIASAIPKSQSTAVANSNGTGVLITSLGSNNAAITDLLNQVAPGDLPASDRGSIASFTGSINKDALNPDLGVLSVTALSSGSLAIGSALTGIGVLPGTTITEVISAFVPATAATAATAGSYRVSQAQTLASTAFKAYPDPTSYAYTSLELVIAGTTLTVIGNDVVGALNTGDRVGGLGIKPGTTVTGVNRDGSGAVVSYTVNIAQTAGSSAAPLTAIAAPGGSSAPYTIEFWTQNKPETNPNGAGLVAYGQPSATTIGEADLPDGWLLESSFVVDLITYQQAAGRGDTTASTAIASGTNGADLYAWGWAVIADGANTTAMDGNGGSNLYSNALRLNNLRAGVTLSGVTAFLEANGLTPTDLTGLGGAPADVISSVPQTQLQFAHFIDEEPTSPSYGLATSNLNTIAIDTSSANLNQGVLLASSASSAITTLFNSLWEFQQKTGEAKVTFSLADNPTTPASSTATPLSIDQFAGYELGFSLSSGPAVSINGNGQIVFDVAPGMTLVSADGVDYRDNGWHYVAASYLPDYRNFTSPDGTLLQLPANSGTASLYINNQLVAQSTAAAPVIDAYATDNVNDQLLILANNNQGAIDQLAIYNDALSTETLPAIPSGWDVPNSEQALVLLREAGLLIDRKTPDPGAIPGAVTAHWDARNVNPNDAELATFYSVFSPSGEQTGSWSTPTTINPQLAVVPTIASATSSVSSHADNWLLSLPTTTTDGTTTTDWATLSWSVSTATSASKSQTGFNPSGLRLESITVKLGSSSASGSSSDSTKTITLAPEQVLLGNSTLADLQPLSTNAGADLNYTILSYAPAFSLLIDRKDAQNHDQATITFSFAGGTTATSPALNFNQVATVQASLQSTPADPTKKGISPITADVQKNNTALATAAVIEQAPLQLKYIDSGEVFRSQSSAATANQTAASTPAQSFGTSQTAGSFQNTNNNSSSTSTTTTYSGWLAIAQPRSNDAISDPGGRVWIQYTGDFTTTDNSSGSSNPNGIRTAVTTAATAPLTWLNALANSNFSPEHPNLPLLDSATNQSSTGGLMIIADATVGWGDNFGQVMLSVDVSGDGIDDLVISAPEANGGGCVYIINGTWIQNTLTTDNGATTLNLANPDDLGDYVLVLTPGVASSTSSSDDAGLAGFGTALAFDESTNTLWIGAPNYLRQLNSADTQSLAGVQPIGALYSFNIPSGGSGWSSAKPQSLTPVTTGQGGTSTAIGPDGSPITTYWGSMLGTAIALSSDGTLAVSAPGFSAGLLYSGTQAAQESYSPESKRNPSSPDGDGALIGVQLPGLSDGLYAVDITNGTNSSFTAITTGKSPTAAQSTYMQNLKALQTDNIAGATIYNNQAVQSEAIGAVYLYNNASSGITTPAATFYGPHSWNVLGASGFGSSLAFIDLNNANTSQLAIGADATGGSGAVYVIDKEQVQSDANDLAASLGGNQYLAHAVASLTLYGAESQDLFGSGIVNLGDVNQDGYDDLLIQAMNAASAAGAGYVLFGSDQFDSKIKGNPATGSVASGSIGLFSSADGTSFSSAILQQLGYGSGFTGSGSYGSGDIDANGINDIQLGSGPNGSAYLTWGHPYLEAVNNLALNKLASNTGYLLDGLATSTAGSLRSIGDFNGDGYGDFISIEPGTFVNNVRIELGANTQQILADYLYNYYSFTVSTDTQVLPAGDINGDGLADLALFLNQNVSSAADGNQGGGSTTGIVYGRNSEQLPIGSAFGLLAPVDPATNAPLTSLPSQQIAGGESSASPAVIAVGDTLYAAVQGVGDGDTSIWFTSSSDGGSSWSNWSDLSDSNPTFATTTAPSLAFFEQKLYMSFLNPDGELMLASFNPESPSLSDWSSPATITSSDNTSASFTSVYTPQLINQGDALGILWVDPTDGSLHASVSTTPDQVTTGYRAPSPWSDVQEGSSAATPALAQLGDTLYMAVQSNDGGSNIYWTSSSDGGSSWASWQALPDSMTSYLPPSLAVFNNTLYLSFIPQSGDIHITSLTDASTNTWADSNATTWTEGAVFASLVTEIIGGSEQLALYYVSNETTGSSKDPTQLSYITRSATSDPASSPWSFPYNVNYLAIPNANPQDNVYDPQTASGPLSVVSINGETVIAYQGGTLSSQSDEIYLATSSTPSNGDSWSAQAYTDPNQRTNVGLSSHNGQLILSYTSSSDPDALQLDQLSGSGGSWTPTATTSVPLDDISAESVALLQVGASGLLFAGTNGSEGNAVAVSFAPNFTTNVSWSAPKQLQERSESNGVVSFSPITPTAAPAATLLGADPVIAVNTGGTINVYSPSSSGGSLVLASSFSTSGSDPAISSSVAPGLTTTDTGLALTYTNSDTSVSLERLDFFSLDGEAKDGVILNADGLDASKAGLLWQKIILDASNSALSTVVGTAPVVVNGNLLLTTVDDSTSAVRISAIPNGSDPASTTWLNTTIQLPDGNGGWLISQPDANATSTLVAAGDLDGDGLDDLLLTSDQVAADGSTFTGLRVISGSGSPQALAALNDPTAAKQAVQIAPALPVSSPASVAASISAPGTLSLTATSAGQLYGLSTSLSDPSSLLATAGSLSSAQQLFSSAIASGSPGWSSTSTPPLTGNLSLNTASTFGDLNGDGYNDYFDPDGSIWIASAPEAPVFSLWSIRAAGDVNGNGVDDVLLALTPQGPSYPAQSDGSPSAIYSALIDGALFKVTNNSFNLSDLKAALNPYNSTELFDVSTMSYSDEYQSLQNWFSPIQKYQAGSLQSLSATAATGGPGTIAPTIVRAPDGRIFEIYNQGGGVGISQYGGEANNFYDITRSTGFSNYFGYLSIAPLQPAAAVHNNKLVIAIPTSPPGALYAKNSNTITILQADIGAGEPSNWNWSNAAELPTPSTITPTYPPYTVTTTVTETTLITPTLVSEGERLALYFPSGSAGNNDEDLNIRYLFSTDPADSTSWGSTYNKTTNSYSGVSGILAINTKTSSTGLPNGSMNNGTIPVVTSPIAATSYQGRTVLAFRSYEAGGGYNPRNGSLLLALAPTSHDLRPQSSDEGWTLYNTNYTGINGVGLTTDQGNLYLTAVSYQDPSVTPSAAMASVQLLAQDPATPVSSSDITTSSWQGLNNLSLPKGNTFTGSSYFTLSDASESVLGVPPVAVTPYIGAGGQLSLSPQGGAPSSSASVTLNTSGAQMSLAGYSIDGNIDVNGDGFTDILLSDPSDPSGAIDNQYVLFGGDYLDLANWVGTAGNDVAVGTPLADVIYTIAGDDAVTSNGGADVIYTGDGADVVSITDNSFIRIDTGSGIDKLLLEGDVNQAYDFRLDVASPEYFAGTKLRNIELISSYDYGSNTLSFDPAAVSAFNDDRVLFLTPDATDSINLSADFERNQAFDTNYGGSLWYAYAAGGGTTGTTSPTLAYVRVPDGNIASTWLASQVIVGGQAPTTPMLASLSATSAEPSASQLAAGIPSMVAGTTSFGDGLTITAYRTTPGSGVALFQISRDGDLSRSQLVSYVSSSLNSSAEPGRHYIPVAGFLRLEAGQASADISVPVDPSAIAALRNGTLSLKVAELDDRGQQQIHLLLDVDQASGGLRPVLSGLDLQVDDSGALATIGFRADANKDALKDDLATTLNLNVRRRLSADLAANDLGNRNQTLSISDGLRAKFDQDGLDNNQVHLELVLNTTTGSIQLQAAQTELNPLILSKLDPTRKPITVGIELTTTSLDAIPVATPPSGVLLNQTAIDFTVDADSSGKAKLFLDLTQVGGDLDISVFKDGVLKRKDQTHLLYIGIDGQGNLSPLTYNARHKAGARFYDKDGNGIADFVSLTFFDGGVGDTGQKGDGKVHDPSTAGTVDLQNVLLTAVDSRTLQAADQDNKDAPASLVLRAALNRRSATTNQIYYVVHDSLDPTSFDSIFADIDELRERSQTLYTSLESTDVTLAPGSSLGRDILLINGQLVRFFEVVDGTLDQLTSATDGRLRVFSTGGFSTGSRSGNLSSTSGVSLALSLVSGDQGLGALIGQEQGLAPVLDFTAFTTDQRIEGTVTLAREADFDSVTGFYRTLDLQGTVWRDPSDQSKGTIAPGQVGTTAADYGAAALRNMFDGLTGLQVGNRQTSNRSISLQESNYLAPIAQVKGNTFVAFASGNADGISHFVSLGSNMFGLEDLYGGGDRDFDDQVIGFAFSKVFTPAV